GRFDVLVQVLPPKASEKLKRWPIFKDKLRELLDDEVRKKLQALTFDETRALARRLGAVRGMKPALDLVDEAYKRCTMRAPFALDREGAKCWEQVCELEESKIRGVVPGLVLTPPRSRKRDTRGA